MAAPSPIFNKTFLVYRCSPLFNFPNPTTPAALRRYNRPLLDLLKGTSLRGVQLSTLEDEIGVDSNIGQLTGVEWSTLPVPRPLRTLDSDLLMDSDDEDDNDEEPRPQMIAITLTYAHPPSVHTALLLPSSGSESSTTSSSSANYPLLLLRFPASTRDAFLHYLSTTFDAFIAPYDLPSSNLCSMLETYLSHRISLSEASLRHRGLYPPPPGKQAKKEEKPVSILAKGKEIVLTLDGNGTIIQDESDQLVGDIPEEEDTRPVLTAMTVTLPAGDLPRLYEGGEAIRELYETYMAGIKRYGREKYLAMTSKRSNDADTTMGGTEEDGENEDYQRLFPEIPKHRTGPLFIALDAYLNSGMGVEAFRLALQKVACSGFVAGGRRVKIFPGGAEVLKVLIDGSAKRFGEGE
ncbi:hypothetical protein BJ508DRAFT_18979 [Ascobolus immersus RN42]|uniref:Uncharacterized protein n=1 Tax=Ascobolus immersus RN42 TaxID=1160509 RepID=A0A3N4I0W8_ASCIM|nr:hypothetical protein BJ508DRAFT_18979 [Ascobolus immersus RN42]